MSLDLQSTMFDVWGRHAFKTPCAQVGCIWLSAMKWSDYWNDVLMRYVQDLLKMIAVLWMYFPPRLCSHWSHVTDHIIAEYFKYDLISVPTSAGPGRSCTNRELKLSPELRVISCKKVDKFDCIINSSLTVLEFSFSADILAAHRFCIHPGFKTYIQSMCHCGPN